MVAALGWLYASCAVLADLFNVMKVRAFLRMGIIKQIRMCCLENVFHSPDFLMLPKHCGTVVFQICAGT